MPSSVVATPLTDATYDIVQSGNTLKLSGKQLEDYDGDGKEETYTVTLEMTKV